MGEKMLIRNSIQLTGIDRELKDYLKTYLTTLNPVWLEAETFGRFNRHIPKFLTQYEEVAGGIVVPRGLLLHLLLDLGREWEIVDERVAPAAQWDPGNIILWDYQELAIEEILKFDNGFLSSPAGSGKTVIALELARRLGLKTLWLTHQLQLKRQVMEEAESLLNIPPKKIGIIHGPTLRLGEQLTVGMIPTLRNRDLAPLAQEFGTVIIDEAHHVPSSSFLKVANQFWAQYIYGFTATAFRRDKLEAVMFNSIGPKLFEITQEGLVEDEQLMPATIIKRFTGWTPENAPLLEFNDFMELMVEAKARNELIVEDVVRECIPGNACVVLVERTKHAEILNAMLKERGVLSELVVGSIDRDDSLSPKSVRAGVERRRKKIIPKKVREKTITDFKEGRLQVVVATYDLLMEGFNYKPLNRLFMATPIKYKGSVIQALGRIQRISPGKENAKAYDYVDEKIAMFWRQAEHRENVVYMGMSLPIFNL